MPKTREPAPYAPVARVLPLLGISHLDRVFEYTIDTEQDALAQPGVLVRIRFAGRLINGLLLERSTSAQHTGKLQWLDRIISPEVIYPERTRALVESLAQRYGGITSDIIRAAIPSRHAKAEESDTHTPWEELGEVTEPDLSYWSSYQHGESFVDAVLGGTIARAAWQMTPGEAWADALSALAVKVVLGGKGALIIVPDQRDLDTLEEALKKLIGPKQITVLNAALGNQARYRRFLSILHGQARLVIGTRSAAFAPLVNPGLMVIKDDGDDNLVDPRAPYIHAREVLTTRSTLEKCSLILAGVSRSTETQLLVESGWVHDLVASRDTIRTRMPRIRATADSDIALERDRFAATGRLPALAFSVIRDTLARGESVLVQVPRTGYVPTLACKNCKTSARCRHCNGPLGIPEVRSNSQQPPAHILPGPHNQRRGNNEQLWHAAVPTCHWCGRKDNHFTCSSCGHHAVRAVVLGQARTAEEFGRAFPKTRIVTSGGNRVLDTIPAGASLVIATPGAEPKISQGSYGAAVLLDSWALLGRQDLRAAEDTFAKWTAAASLVCSHLKGGEVVVVADASLSVVQHFIRWDVVGRAAQELAERRDVRFPPAVNMAAVDGPSKALDQFIDIVELPEHAEILGPVDLPPGVKLPGEYDEATFGPPQRLLIRTPLGPRAQLGKALRAAHQARLARKDSLPLRIQIDPIRIG
ncbi:MAG: primosomal protein N' [Corynebacterium sp.]|uniref:primosomal protein N' n=1 Tax=Corynebacterium sp. TaxID=1720 RepID=UPI0026DB7078|nr:primosomal protein N' [Corynebacterium sp.]MDO4760363.1 primosomal protein N' [Corynebacterium sp.]